jgi:hypothetical protein
VTIVAEFSKVEQALVYYTECNLATLERLQALTRTSKWERQRQKNICDGMVQCCRDFGLTAGRHQPRLDKLLRSTSIPEHSDG